MKFNNSNVIMTQQNSLDLSDNFVSPTQFMFMGYVYNVIIKESILKHIEGRFDDWYEYIFNDEHTYNIVNVCGEYHVKNLYNDIVPCETKMKTIIDAQLFADTL